MTQKQYDRELLAYKIRWEGGVLGALDYGLQPDDISDRELRTAWRRLCELHSEMRPLVLDFEKRLRGAAKS